MTSAFSQSHYELISRLSDNGFTQSWEAVDRQTGQRMFVKTLSEKSELEPAFIVDTLSRSAQEQHALQLRFTVRTRRLVVERDACLVAYPWLERCVAYPDFLASRGTLDVIIEIAVITDYLHALGLVHRDLKLSNFVEIHRGHAHYVALTDLDLLSKINVPCDRKIFGTPGMIAPEVSANRVFTPRADLYSLGRSAERYFEEHGWPSPTEAWRRLVGMLTDSNPHSRPEHLLESMQQCGLLSDSEFRHHLKRLLAALLLTRFKQRRPGGAGWMQRFVTDQNQVFGIPEELLRDLEGAFATHPRRALGAFRRLIEKATLSRASDFWLLPVTDEILGEVYDLLGSAVEWNCDRPDPRTSLSVLPGVPYALHDQPLKRLLTIKRVVSGPTRPTESECAVLLAEAGDLAMILNRTREACELFEKALERTMPDRERLHLLRKLMLQQLILSRTKQSRELAARALSLARKIGDNEALLDIRRHEAWFVATDGRAEEAEQLTAAIAQEAEAANLTFVRIRCLLVDYQRLCLMQDHAGALRVHEEIVAASEAAGHPEYSLSNRIGQINTYFTASAYRKAEALAQQVDRQPRPPHLNYLLPWYYSNRLNGLVRLGEFGRAKYSLHRILADSDPVSYDALFRRYYSGLCWIQIGEGRLLEAELSAVRSLSFKDRLASPEDGGYTLQNLCNTYMRMGRYEACRDAGRKAADSFDPTAWPIVIEEIAMVLDLNEAYNGTGLDWETFLERQARLFALRGLYYAVTATFHILVNADEATAQKAIAVFNRATAELTDNEFPLLQATRLLAQGRTANLHKRVGYAKALKAAIRVLEHVGDIYSTMLLCERIAGLDRDQGSRRRARGYLQMALTIAQALPNATARRRIEKQLETLDISGDTRLKMLESMLSLSQIFSETADYEDALMRMLRFAIDESGAERGALFLVSSQSPQLLLRASVDCDEASLKDIEGISSRLLSRARHDPEPNVIADARSDKNLQQYKSVVANNIRSVATVPMFAGGTLRGLLYMDHHTVPARFDDSDLLYIRSIANFLGVILNAIDRQRAVAARVDRLGQDRQEMGIPETMVAEDPAMLTLLKELPQIARTNASILVRGESGTGKELLVELIHALSLRADKPLVKVNCAAISNDLMEVELFGIKGGVASNVAERQGKFEYADGGTLFLDEVGDMSPRIQAAVLRCLEYQQFERIGSHRTIHTDIRFIYATNQNLEELVEQGKFRLDLYNRIKVIDLVVPPLRERPRDIVPLINYFGRTFHGPKEPPLGFTEDALAAILAYPWPGNVRELRNMVERLSILEKSGLIGLDQLQEPIRGARRGRAGSTPPVSAEELSLRRTAEQLGIDLRWLEAELAMARQPGHLGLSPFELLEREVIRSVAKSNHGNASLSARMLGYSVATLRRRIKKYGLDHRI